MSAAPYLRLGGCRERPDSCYGTTYIEGLQSVYRAELFTVYLMDREGLAHALVDATTLQGGVALLLEVGRRAGLEVSLCPFLTPSREEGQ